MSRGCIALLIASMLVVPAFARAEPTPEDRALATDLFRRGRDLLAAGQSAKACEKLEASQRLDPSGGTVLNLALCHEQLGRTATAWSEFAEALSVAKRDRREDRVQFAAEHIAALERQLSRLAVIVDEEATGVVVVRDGTELPRAAWRSEAPIDPGVHVIEAHADGHVVFRTEVTIAPDGDRKTVHIPRVTPLPAAPRQAHRESSGFAAAALGISGVAGIAVGSVSGIHALALRRSSDELCAHRCTEDAVDRNERAKGAADVSTTAFVIAGVLLTATFYFLLTKRQPQPAAIVHF